MVQWVLSDQVRLTWFGARLAAYLESAPALAVALEDAHGVALLEAFKTPADPVAVAQVFRDRLGARAEELLRELAGIGALVPARGEVERPPDSVSAAEDRQALLARRDKLAFLRYDDLGLTVTSCGKGELSPGCQACKDGTWLCVFVGMSCNATCAFCPQPAVARVTDDRGFGSGWVERLLAGLEEHRAKLRGVSLSGGEPFLYEPVVKRITSFVKERLPGVYLWAYTNGIAVTADNLARFRDYGLDEIRFNLAASEFDLKIMAKIRDYAVRIMPWVSVEVPMYPATHEHLIGREKLVALEEMGVKQLNLGQLFSGSRSSAVMSHFGDTFRAGGRQGVGALVAEARHWTHDVFEHAYKKGLKVRINDCSEDAKQAQTLARDRRGGPEMHALYALAYPRPDAPQDLLAPPADATRTTSELTLKTLRGGRGTRTPLSTDSVALRYMGWTMQGEVFDSSYSQGLEGVYHKVSDLMPGLAEGLATMTVGEKRRLWIPLALTQAGAARASQGHIVVDIELTDIRPAELPC